MTQKKKFVFSDLSNLLENALPLPLSKQDKFVIFSDLHMGNGGRLDDFRINSTLFTKVLLDYYFEKDYKLILNGDVEELHKFSLRSIQKAWNGIYDIFDGFEKKNRLLKTVGNHDITLIYKERYRYKDVLYPAIKFDHGGDTIFVFHGHQASDFLEKYNTVIGYILRYIARPFGIKNYSAAYNSRKRFEVERKVHEFSKNHKLISIIGHTHRPLFESLSKIDTLKFKIEQLLRAYSRASTEEKPGIAKDIKNYRQELLHFFNRHEDIGARASLYDAGLIIPSLFNSGCGIGRWGITSIEITGGEISLVHWFHVKRHKSYHKHFEKKPQPLGNSPYLRMVLKSDFLNYIFSRIKLLTV